MPVSMGERLTGPGWGCNCRAFRMGEPTPEQALAALARSANVTVWSSNGKQFVAWTEPGNRYDVTWDPDKPGGWCKHTIACLVHWAPWHRQLALGADATLADIHRLEKELRAANRKIARLEAK